MGKFTAIQTYDRFTKLKNANKINERSLNFILDTGQLYTHGIFLNNVAWGTETTGAVELTIAGVKKTLSLSNHTHSNYLEKNANIDLGAYKIVSGTKDLLYYSSGNTYLGNTSSPLILQGSSGSIKKGDTTYTILDTLNFTILAVSSAGHSLQNAAKITYGSSNFQIDYIKRLNTTLAFNDLNAYSSAGVTLTDSKYYAFITLRNDGSDTASWAQVRFDIASKTMQYRTSAASTAWYNVITSIPSNALNVAGIVAAPTSSDANKVWKTDASGNPGWKDDTNTLYYLTLNGTVYGSANTTNLGTFYAIATSNASAANQVWMRNADNNGYAWRTLGSRAFDSTSYLPLTGGSLTGKLTITIPDGYGWLCGNDNYHGVIMRGASSNYGSSLSISSGDVMEFIEYGGIFNFKKVTTSENTTIASITPLGMSLLGYTVYHSGNLPAYPTKASWNYDDRYVTALSTNGNYLTWTKNGTTNNITVPYASNAGNTTTLDGLDSTDFVRWYKNHTTNPDIDAMTDLAYMLGTDSSYGAGTKPPNTDNAVGIINLRTYGSYHMLIAMVCSGNTLWTRSAPGLNTFNSWERLAKASEIPTKSSWNYDDVYLKLTGGTMTGTIKWNSTSLPQKSSTPYAVVIDAFANGGEMGWRELGTNAFSSTSYLPLSGGTLSAPLTIACGHDRKFYINNTDQETYWSLISFQDNGTEYGTLGTSGDTNLRWNSNIIIHSGNISSQSVNYATSAGNADTLDNLHAAYILTYTNYIGNSGYTYNNFNSALPMGVIEVHYGGSITNHPSDWEDGTNHYGQMLHFGDAGDNHGYILLDRNTENMYFKNIGGTSSYGEWYKVIHSGNISSLSVSYANNAGNADTVDSLHAITQTTNYNSISSNPSIFISAEYNTTNAPTTDYNYGIKLRFHRSNGTYQTDIVSGLYTDALYYRRYYDGSIGSWKQIAFTDSNVSSATQLLTTRTLWGQNFNGTANVSGDMSDVGWINSVMKISYQGNARLYVQGVPDNTDYINMYVSDGSDNIRPLGLLVGRGNVGIGTGVPAYKLDVSGTTRVQDSLIVSSNNTTGGGIILADDGDIVDLNDGYAAMRFSYGVRIYSANRGGSWQHELNSNGKLSNYGVIHRSYDNYDYLLTSNGDARPANQFVYRKDSTNVYNFIGSSAYSSTGWFRVTFPHAGTTTENTYWFMLSMDVIFGGSYNYAPNGKVRLSYYFSRNPNSYTTNVGNVYAVALGNDLGAIRICYNPNDAAYMYIYNGGQYYGTVTIKNLTITDNGQLYEYLNTTIVPCDAPSGVTDVTINKIYSGGGGSMTLNGNTLWHSGNDGSGSGLDADTVDGQHFSWSNSDNNPTWIWGANSNGTAFLASRANMSVNYASSAGNADTVDSRHATGFVYWEGSPSKGNMNDIARSFYSATGMTSLNSSSVDNGDMSGWTHFFNTSYADGGNGSNAWVFQLACPAGTSNLQFRSRSGGAITDGTAWTVGWTKIIHASNYTSYTVTKTGGGASGTWGINITGSAGSVAWSNVTGKPFNWSGQSGQPSWLWGSNDGSNYYVWNPSNFSVNYAASAGTANGLWFSNDGTLKLYSTSGGGCPSCGNETVCLQTSIDGTDGLTHSHPTEYLTRCVLALLPRGGYVGINTVSPSYPLHVNGSAYFNGDAIAVGGIYALSGSDLILRASSGSNDCGDIVFQDGSNTEIGRIWYDGLLGGNFLVRFSSSDTPKTLIHSGNISNYVSSGGDITTGYWNAVPFISNDGVMEIGKYVDWHESNNDGTDYRCRIECRSGSLYITGSVNAPSFYTTSDAAKKKNITQFSDHIYRFTYKESNKDAYGVIAQNVEEMFRDGEEGNMTVNYDSVLSYYVGQLENKVAQLERELNELKSKYYGNNSN